jgi:hypothetical protein
VTLNVVFSVYVALAAVGVGAYFWLSKEQKEQKLEAPGEKCERNF